MLQRRPAAAKAARDFLAHTCRAQNCGVLDDARLLVSELVANAVEHGPDVVAHAPAGTRVEVTEAGHGEGFYEAVVRTLAEAR